MKQGKKLKIIKIKEFIECSIIERVNRFTVKILVDNREVSAYINNTGRLNEYLIKGRKAYCLRKQGGKTSYRLFAVEDMGMGAVIDTQLQMKAFEESIKRRVIPWLNNCEIVKRNVRLGSSLIDYLVRCGRRKVYLEVKSAVLRGNSVYAMYPDCPTIRGRKHLRELIMHVLNGGAALILFIAALPKVKAFKPNLYGDPEIPALLREAWGAGVDIRAINIFFNQREKAIMMENPNLDVKLI